MESGRGSEIKRILEELAADLTRWQNKHEQGRDRVYPKSLYGGYACHLTTDDYNDYLVFIRNNDRYRNLQYNERKIRELEVVIQSVHCTPEHRKELQERLLAVDGIEDELFWISKKWYEQLRGEKPVKDADVP